MLRNLDNVPEKEVQFFKLHLTSFLPEEDGFAATVEMRRTYFAESFHALCNKYCPKHQVTRFEMYSHYKALAFLHWNEVRERRLSETPPVLDFQRKLIVAIVYGNKLET